MTSVWRDRQAVDLFVVASVSFGVVLVWLAVSLYGTAGMVVASGSAMALTVASLWPGAALVASIASYLVDGWLERQGVPGWSILAIQTVLPVVVVVRQAVLMPGSVPKRTARLTWLAIALVGGFCFLGLVSAVPPMAVLLGSRVLLVPLAYVIAVHIPGRWLTHRLPVTLALLAALSAVESLRQRVSGVGVLRVLGYEQGVGLRTLDGLVRAPGLATTNYSNGLMAAATLVFLLYTVRWMWTSYSGVLRAVVLLGAVSAGASVWLSTLRSAAVAALVAVGVFAWSRARLGGRIALCLAGVLLGSFVYRGVVSGRGVFSTFSLEQRLANWQGLSGGDLILGRGVGAYGVGARAADSSFFFVGDNSIVTLLLQLGIVGCASLLGVFGALVLWRSGAVRDLLPVGLFLVAAALTIDVHEFVGVMAIVAATGGLQMQRSPFEDDLLSSGTVEVPMRPARSARSTSSVLTWAEGQDVRAVRCVWRGLRPSKWIAQPVRGAPVRLVD